MLDETFSVVFKHCAYCTMMNRKVKSAQLLLKLENDFPFGFTNHHVTAAAASAAFASAVKVNCESIYTYVIWLRKQMKWNVRF